MISSPGRGYSAEKWEGIKPRLVTRSTTRGQRCWVHKTANVLNKLPTSQQSKAKRPLSV